MNGYCADCGEALDRFGICPFADPERARVERAPVNCGYDATHNAQVVRDHLSAISMTPVRSHAGWPDDWMEAT